MLEYRLSADDDDIDDYDEEANINVEDNLGDYGIDDDDEVEEVIIVTETISVPVAPASAPGAGTPGPEASPAKKPAKKAASAKKPAAASCKSCRQEGRPKESRAQESGCQERLLKSRSLRRRP